MTLDLDKLEELAKKATSGRREWSYYSLLAAGHKTVLIAQDGHVYSEYTADPPSLEISDDDKAFIAALDTKTVLSLIAEARAGRELRKMIGESHSKLTTVNIQGRPIEFIPYEAIWEAALAYDNAIDALKSDAATKDKP